MSKKLFLTKSPSDHFSRQVDRNLNGMENEKKGDVELAISEYEKNINEGFVGNHPYDRLAIIYRKNKDFTNEVRVLSRGVEVFTDLSRNSPRQDVSLKLEKFQNRLKTVQILNNLKQLKP